MDYKDKLRIMNFIRLSFRQSKTMQEAMANSVHPTLKGVRGGKLYTCIKCKKAFRPSSVQVDHIFPVIGPNQTKRTIHLYEYITSVYCSIDNLQVLCKSCHLDKSTH